MPFDFEVAPAYGNLSLTEERYWYGNYRYDWLRYVEHELHRQLVERDDAYVNRNWPLMSHEQKAAVWALMSEDERKRIRQIRSSR